MSRTIKKKVISENLLFSDDFDEEMLGKIEKDLDGSMSEPKTSQPKASLRPSRNQANKKETEEITQQGGSFDQDETRTAYASSTIPEKTSGAPMSDQLKKQIFRKKLLVGTLLCLPLIAVAAASVIYLRISPQPLPSPQIIRHPIPKPVYEAETSFLLQARNKEDFELLELKMQMSFKGTKGYEVYRANEVFCRYLIYEFLQNRRSPNSSYTEWRRLVQEELLSHLKENWPELNVTSIEIQNLGRI